MTPFKNNNRIGSAPKQRTLENDVTILLIANLFTGQRDFRAHIATLLKIAFSHFCVTGIKRLSRGHIGHSAPLRPLETLEWPSTVPIGHFAEHLWSEFVTSAIERLSSRMRCLRVCLIDRWNIEFTHMMLRVLNTGLLLLLFRSCSVIIARALQAQYDSLPWPTAT